MEKFLVCIDNKGMEKSLTINRLYIAVVDYTNDTVKVTDDKGIKLSGYFLSHFKELPSFPEKWWVKPETLEQVKVLAKWADACNPHLTGLYVKNLEPNFEEGFGWGNEGLGKVLSYKTPTGHVIITFDQFEKYVLGKNNNNNNNTNMENKIIGYKLIKPEYDKAARAIGLKDGCGWSQDTRFDITVCSKAKVWLEEAGVLNLWFEPVYEQDNLLKPGEWAITIKEGAKYNYKNKVGEVFRIIDVSPNRIIYNFDEDKGVCVDRVRRATEKEVEGYLVKQAIERGFVYGASFVSLSNGYVCSVTSLVGGHWYYDEVEDTLYTIGHGKRAVYSRGEWAEPLGQTLRLGSCSVEVKIGCKLVEVKGNRINIEDVKNIVHKFTKKNCTIYQAGM